MKYAGKSYGGEISHVGRTVVYRAPGEKRLRSATIEHITNDGIPEIVGRSGSDGRKLMAFVGENLDNIVPHLNFVPTKTPEEIENLPERTWTWPVRV